ncbi:MAG: glycerophosphodiester phosphodiesterase [Halobacteriovoraceae bacterium]|nr:glycerophosphodiester phosphodiesterase [Halobacteriovoraceae bacterium]
MFKTTLLFLFAFGTYAQTCISHRANGFNSPENSRQALESAVNQSVSGVEIDIQVSKDGIPFLYHDSELGKGLEGPSCPIGEKIKSSSFNKIYNECFLENNEKLLTLKSALEVLKNFKGYVFIDLKQKPSEKFYKIFENSSLFDNNKVRFISFKKRALRPIKRRWEKVEVTLLSRYIPRGLFYSGIGFNKRLNFFTGIFRFLGKDVSIWTLNEKEDISKAIDKKADFIITDQYELCREMVSRKQI